MCKSLNAQSMHYYSISVIVPIPVLKLVESRRKSGCDDWAPRQIRWNKLQARVPGLSQNCGCRDTFLCNFSTEKFPPFSNDDRTKRIFNFL